MKQLCAQNQKLRKDLAAAEQRAQTAHDSITTLRAEITQLKKKVDDLKRPKKDTTTLSGSRIPNGRQERLHQALVDARKALNRFEDTLK